MFDEKCVVSFSQVPAPAQDPISGGLKNHGKISKFSAVAISFPTKSGSFMRKTFIQGAFKSVNIFLKNGFFGTTTVLYLFL